jgi:hypothetical protein
MNSFQIRGLKALGKAIGYALIITVIFTVFVPFFPEMPSVSLDPSWKLGMNQAVAQGLTFGQEMIFTFGPYSSIYTQAYHPATDRLMMAGSLYLAVVYCVCFVSLMRNVNWAWIFSYCTVLSGVIYSRDALLFSVPLLIALSVYKTQFSQDRYPIKSNWQILYVAFIFSALGLLPLIKGSLIILCGSVAVLCALFFLLIKKTFPAMLCIIAPLLSIVFFWILIGQHPAALPQYFSNMLLIITGYTEAMALDGLRFEIQLYVFFSALLLLAILSHRHISRNNRTFIFLLYAIYLFISYKAGFVRDDNTHALISVDAILISALLLPFILKDRIFIYLILMMSLVLVGVAKYYVEKPIDFFADQATATYINTWDGICNRIRIPDWPRSEYENNLRSIRKAVNFPALDGTVDIYSYDQTDLIASKMPWSPRPVLQSYSAYTPALADINQKHLTGANAPENIIFRMQPIDGRLPSLEDGPSWPSIMKNYHSTQYKNSFLFFKKNTNINQPVNQIRLLTASHRFGETVQLPYTRQPLFVRLEIRLSLAGRIANIVHKPNQLAIRLDLINGEHKQYRMIAEMAESVFLLSPLVEDTDEFKLLMEQSELLNFKKVKSISITTIDGDTTLWENEYKIGFSHI